MLSHAVLLGHELEESGSTAALAMLSIGWALIMPLLIRLGERLDGISPEVPAGSVVGQRV